MKLKLGQLISVHVDFGKVIKGNSGLFEAVPITFFTGISYFSILGQN